MEFNLRELKKIMNLLEEKIADLEEKLNSENDIEKFSSSHHKIEDYRGILLKVRESVQSKS